LARRPILAFAKIIPLEEDMHLTKKTKQQKHKHQTNNNTQSTTNHPNPNEQT
jgi:hypothetical protein